MVQTIFHSSAEGSIMIEQFDTAWVAKLKRVHITLILYIQLSSAEFSI